MNLPKDKVLSAKVFIISNLAILIFGLLFFAGLYYILYDFKFKQESQPYQPVTKEPTSFILEVGSPEDEILIFEDNIVVSGKTGPDSAVIISNQVNDAGLQADKNGQFSKVFPVAVGANLVEITAIDKDGSTRTVTKSIYYSQEEI